MGRMCRAMRPCKKFEFAVEGIERVVRTLGEIAVVNADMVAAFHDLARHRRVGAGGTVALRDEGARFGFGLRIEEGGVDVRPPFVVDADAVQIAIEVEEELPVNPASISPHSKRIFLVL